MTVTTPPRPDTSTRLLGLLEQASRLAGAAGRSDLLRRLARARGELAARQLRVLVIGAPGQGASTLTRALAAAAGDRLPGTSFREAIGAGAPAPDVDATDVVLLVSQADREYSEQELETIGRIRDQGVTLVGVLTKIDHYPGWQEVQQADRQRLRAAGLDTPAVALVPVSAALYDVGARRGDDARLAASGVPQLLELLRDRIETPVPPRSRDAVLAELRAVADQLGPTWTAELDQLVASGSAPGQHRNAVAELERRQGLSVSWQLALGDGTTELGAQVDFDLRERLRGVLERAEQNTENGLASREWEEFAATVTKDAATAVRASFALSAQRSQRLAEQVGARLAGNPDGTSMGVALPAVRLADPEDALGRLTAMRPPHGGGTFARVVNSLRGSYGGVLMVGVLTSLAGLQLISVYSVGAGVLLGLFTYWEDRKNGRDRGRAEARMALSKLLDEVNFRAGDELRTQLRAVHRQLRDHFTEINDQRLRTAADAVRAATDAEQRGERTQARIVELRQYLGELGQLMAHAGGPTR